LDILSLFLTALVVGFSGAATPGPLLTVTISEVVRRGFWAGPMLVLGHAILELTLLLGLTLGLSEFLVQDVVAGFVRLAGGAFLVWMGLDILRSRKKIRLELIPQGMPIDSGRSILVSGILVSLSNPFWLIWWATIGLTYLTLALEHGRVGIAAFYMGHILADLIWYSLIAFIVAAGRRFVSANVYRGLLIVCGVFLIYIGVRFLYLGLSG
jgi:threonine/homoserine/homoserine lactone efflux protein